MALYRPDPNRPLWTWKDEISERREAGFLLADAANEVREGLGVVVLGKAFVHEGAGTVIAAFIKGVSRLDCVYAGQV